MEALGESADEATRGDGRPLARATRPDVILRLSAGAQGRIVPPGG